MSQVENVEFLTKWLYYSGFLPKYDRKCQKFVPSKLKALILVVLVIIATVLGHGESALIIDFRRESFRILGRLMQIVTITINLVGNSTWNCEGFTKLFAATKKLVLKDNVNIKWIFAIWILYFLLMFIGRCVVEYFEGKEMETGGIFGIILDFALMYNLKCFVFVRLYLWITMRRHLCRLNESLEKLRPAVEPLLEDLIDKLIGDHNDMANWVDNFNDISGVQMLAFKFYEMFHIVSILRSYLSGSDNSTGKIIYAVIHTLTTVGEGISNAHFSQRFTNEGKKTVGCIYDTATRFNKMPRIKKSLMSFAQQAENRSPKFTASGFFTIDHAMLFMFMNLVLTSVILIVQLEK